MVQTPTYPLLCKCHNYQHRTEAALRSWHPAWDGQPLPLEFLEETEMHKVPVGSGSYSRREPSLDEWEQRELEELELDFTTDDAPEIDVFTLAQKEDEEADKRKLSFQKALQKAAASQDHGSWDSLIATIGQREYQKYVQTTKQLGRWTLEDLVADVYEKLPEDIVVRNPKDVADWPKTWKKDVWAGSAWTYVLRTVEDVIADQQKSEMEEQWAAQQPSRGHGPDTDEVSEDDMPDRELAADDTHANHYVPRFKLNKDTGKVEPLRPRRAMSTLEERLAEWPFHGGDPKDWAPSNPLELHITCGDNRGTTRGIEAHAKAGEPNCISLDESRWWGRFVTAADVTVEDPERGTVILEPVDDTQAALSCTDWEWLRRVKTCPACGYLFVAPTGKTARQYCYQPCRSMRDALKAA